MKNETKEIPIAWLEGLLNASERLEESVRLKGEFKKIQQECAINFLQGYIQSAKTLL